MRLKEVPPSGSIYAPIYIVGKCPSQKEMDMGINMVGSDGQQLFRTLNSCGISREDCRISNVVWTKPPGKELSSVTNLGIPENYWLDRLHEDIQARPRSAILVVGDEALGFMCQHTGVLKWRGSVLPYVGDNHTPVVPTILPSYIREGNQPFLLALRSDCRKLYKVWKGGWKPRKRVLVNKSRGADFADFCYYLDRLASGEGFLSYDIEGWYPNISCISFSDHPDWAISVPLNGIFPEEQEDILWEKVKNVLGNGKTGKIAHNMLFDNLVLAQYGIGIKNLFMDTMLAHHQVFQELPHKLDFITSIYTWENYYKDDRTMLDYIGSQKDADDYSCKDAAVTLEIVEPLIREMIAHRVDRFFFTVIMPRVKSMSRMASVGMPILENKRKDLIGEVREELDRLEDFITRNWGINPYSPKQVQELLYERLGYPTQVKRKTKKITTEEDALYKVIQKVPSSTNIILPILDARKKKKELSTYLESRGPEGTRYFSIHIDGAKSGRLSVGLLLDKTGIPAQGIPKHLRKMVGKNNLVVWEADAKQAEAMFVAWRAGEDFLFENFIAGIDIHKTTAVLLWKEVFNTSLDYNQVDKDKRQFAKMCRHAMNYMMGPRQLLDEITKSFPEIGVTYHTCRRMIDVFREMHPKTTAWNKEIQNKLRAGERQFYNCYGRGIMYLMPYTDDLVRSAVSFEPQSTVADTVLMALGNSWEEFDSKGLDPSTTFIFNQVHDSIVGCCLEKDLNQVLEIVVKEMERVIPVEYKGVKLVIPAEFAYGKSWGEMEVVYEGKVEP